MKINLFSLFFVLVLLGAFRAQACQCPTTALSMAECDKYEIIFKGKILSVAPCDHKFGEAVFEIGELYKGNSHQKFTVLFECKVDCAMQFIPGQEWIIYSHYKQLGNAMMDWCSRSRKFFSNEREDFYAVNYGNDYGDEVKFLREKLGLHRLLPEKEVQDLGGNKRPTANQTILLMLCSLAAIILFYWLFNKYFKF